MRLGLGLGLTRPTTGDTVESIRALLFGAGEQGIYTPDMSDLTTLFQDRAGTTPVTAPGQSVGRFLDRSGLGFHAVANSDAARGTYQIDETGRPFILFEGADDGYLTSTITPGTDKAQVFAGVRKLSDANYPLVVELSTNANTNSGALNVIASGANIGSAGWSWSSRGTISAQAQVGSGYTSPITNVITGLGDISGDSAILRVNGVQAAQRTLDQGTGNYLAYPLFIGRRGGTTLPFNGRLYSLIVRFGPNLTADQIARVERFIAQRTGVTI